MATREEIYTAIRNADKAGDSAAVRKLGAYLQTMPADSAAPPAAAAQPEQTSFGQDMAHAAGLAGRAVVEGASGLAALPSDAIFGTANYIQHLRGKPIPFKLASQSIHEGLTAAGLPEPTTPIEKFTSGVETALSGAGTGIGAGNALRSAAGATGAVGGGLAAAPAAQATGAVTGTAAAQGAAALGAPMPIQLLANLAGGATGGALVPTSGAVTRAAGALAAPALESGRRAIAGRVLSTAASNPEAAAENLANAQQLVRGSAPTTGQAGRDVGLAYLEQRLRGIGDPRFNQRTSDQNTARQALLDSVADGGTQPAIQARTAHREAVTGPLRNQAFTEAAGQRAPAENILANIDAQLADPENAGQSVQSALQSIRKQIAGPEKTVTAPDGSQVTSSTPLTDPRALYAVRKEINRVLEGKYVGADESVLRYAGGQLKNVRNSIDDAISSVAPSWKTYLTKYAQLSKPIERTETMQDVRNQTAIAAPDISTGRDVLSQAKWKTVVDRALPDLQQTLTNGQIAKLRMITSDLDRGAAAISAGKTAGSDTAANLATKGQISVANVIGRALGKGKPEDLPPGLATITRPLAFIYKLPDEHIRSLLVDAMLDPRLASQLMREGTIENVRRFAADLAKSSSGATTGAATGSAGQGAQ